MFISVEVQNDKDIKCLSDDPSRMMLETLFEQTELNSDRFIGIMVEAITKMVRLIILTSPCTSHSLTTIETNISLKS